MLATQKHPLLSIPIMSRGRLFLNIASVVDDRANVDFLLNTVDDPAPAPYIPRIGIIESPLYQFQLFISQSTYTRVLTFRQSPVAARQLNTFIRPDDVINMRIRSRDLGTQTNVGMGDASMELVRLVTSIGIPADVSVTVSIFPRRVFSNNETAFVGGRANLVTTFQNGIGTFSWTSIYELLENQGYFNFSFTHVDMVLQFPLRDVIRSNFRGGCVAHVLDNAVPNGMATKLNDIYAVNTPTLPSPWLYYQYDFGMKVQIGKENLRQKAPHLKHLSGLFYMDHSVLPPNSPPICGVTSVALGLAAYNVRTSDGDNEDKMTALTEYVNDPARLFIDVMEYLVHHGFDPKETQSFSELCRFLRMLNKRCHFIVFDSTQKPIYWDYSKDTVNPEASFKNGKTLSKGELSLARADMLQNHTVAVFYDHETLHFMPIFDLGLFLTKHTTKNKSRKRSASDMIENAYSAIRESGEIHDVLGSDTVNVCKYVLCYGCHAMVSRSNQRCRDHFCHRFICRLCQEPFLSRRSLAMHLTVRQEGYCCYGCGSVCPNQKCHSGHQRVCTRGTALVTCPYCYMQITETSKRHHSCPTYECHLCKSRVKDTHVVDPVYHPDGYLKTHPCHFLKASPKTLDVKDAVFAFDFESMLYTDQNLQFPFMTVAQERWCEASGIRVQRFPVYIHIVNCASFCKIPDNPMDALSVKTVHDLGSFWKSICEVGKNFRHVYFYAHNMRGYDGRLLADFLERSDVAPVSMIEVGAKYMEIVYINPLKSKQRIVFRDSLSHVQAPLKHLPAMFGLDPSIVKKGYFPYLFNTPTNQGYRGNLPSRAFFNTEVMDAEERHSFDQWYSSRIGMPYDLREEMVAYCENDVEVLARSLCSYRNVCLSYTPSDPLSCITIAQFVFNLYRAFYMPEKTIYYMDEYFSTFARRALCGGNTNANRLYYNADTMPDIVGLHYFDIVSLYPTVQFYDPMPTGQPKTTLFTSQTESDTFLNRCDDFFGFIELDIDVIQFNPHPIIPYRHDGKLLLTNLNHRYAVLTSPEFHYIRTHPCYKIRRVHRIDMYIPSTDLFKSFIRTWMRLKITSSKKPTNLDSFLLEVREKLGIDINEDDFDPNPAIRSLAKLILNSLWGKFGERTKKRKCKFMKSGAERFDYFKKVREGTLNQSSLQMYGQTHVLAKYKKVYERETKNVAIASFVTSHARLRFQKMCDAAGFLKFYGDTDSVIVGETVDSQGVSSLKSLVKPGYMLGDWEPELGQGCVIKEYVALAPKTYAFRYTTPDGQTLEKVKAKGFPQTELSKNTLNFDVYKRLLFTKLRPGEVDEPLDSSCVRTLSFKHIQDQHTMITHDFLKTLSFNYQKGYVDPVTFHTFPYGSKRFFTDDVTTRWIHFKEVLGHNGSDTVVHTRHTECQTDQDSDGPDLEFISW